MIIGTGKAKPTIPYDYFNSDEYRAIFADMWDAAAGCSDLAAEVAALRRRLDAMQSGSELDAIDNLEEVIDFLDGIKETDRLRNLLAEASTGGGVAAASPDDIDKVIDTVFS